MEAPEGPGVIIPVYVYVIGFHEITQRFCQTKNYSNLNAQYYFLLIQYVHDIYC